MKSDLRNAHFHLGNNPVDYLSTAKQNMVGHDPSVSTQSQQLAHELQSKMQTVSFKIGDEKKRDLKDVASIYKQTISSSSTNMGMYNREAKSLASLKNSNINFGNEKKVDYVSEAKEKFIPQAHSAMGYQRQQRPPNNVTLQETSDNYFETVYLTSFL
jgi:hypothetical protein